MSNVLFDAPGPLAVRRHRLIATATIAGLILVAVAVVWKLAAEDQFTADKWEPFVTPGIIRVLLEALGLTVFAAAFAIVGSMNSAIVRGPARYGSVPSASSPVTRNALGPIAAT